MSFHVFDRYFITICVPEVLTPGPYNIDVELEVNGLRKAVLYGKGWQALHPKHLLKTFCTLLILNDGYIKSNILLSYVFNTYMYP